MATAISLTEWEERPFCICLRGLVLSKGCVLLDALLGAPLFNGFGPESQRPAYSGPGLMREVQENVWKLINQFNQFLGGLF
jgi:hypothetical protein